MVSLEVENEAHFKQADSPGEQNSSFLPIVALEQVLSHPQVY